jgi:hypothetical protein
LSLYRQPEVIKHPPLSPEKKIDQALEEGAI